MDDITARTFLLNKSLAYKQPHNCVTEGHWTRAFPQVFLGQAVDDLLPTPAILWLKPSTVLGDLEKLITH